MAKTYYFPKKIGDQRNWLENYRTQIGTVGPALGMTAGEVTDNTDAADAIIDSIDATTAAENTYKQKVSDKDAAMKTNFNDLIRPAVQRLKTSPSYTEGAGDLLGINGPESGFDPDTFKPTGKAELFPGEVKLSFKKSQADGVYIYSRTLTSGDSDPSNPSPSDEAEFNIIALDLHSPYVDNRPLATPGKPEVREYYFRAMLNDQKIGQPSDIIKVTVSA